MSTEAIASSMALDAEPEVNGQLYSPPDSTNAPTKIDATDSELSDLDENDDDIGEITPDHYDGGVPVFKPTYHQFKNFIVYTNKINHYGMKSGIVKVIPPAEWKAEQPNLDEIIKTIRVKDPIKQDIMGTNGLFRQANLLHQRAYNLPSWRKLCEQSDHQPPAKRGERRANAEPHRPATRARTSTPAKVTVPLAPGAKRKPGRPRKINVPKLDDEEEEDSLLDRLPTPISPKDEDTDSIKDEPHDDYTPAKGRGTFSGRGAFSGRGRQPKATASVSSRRKNNRRDTVGKIDQAAFKNFDYRVDGSEYTRERCEELERAYWKTLTYAAPLYGADMPGTLFDDRTTAWNLGKLENLLDVIGTKIPGVNTAYLYMGMWKATFAWHLEDVDLYSINYNHFGAPKQWYSIAQGDARRFEDAMKKSFPIDARACDQFLRHKTFLISPAHLLQNYNIRVNKIVHHPGEFVITYPYGYHSGYNLGYNCAEAVNFALDSWLEFGRVAKKCECDQAQDSVWIDVAEIERKLRGEKTPEYYEVTDDEEDEEDEEEDEIVDLPTPPDSSGDAIKKSNRGRKRKRGINEKDDKKVKKVRRVGKIGRQPCCLCPNDLPFEPLLPTDNGKQAHRICAEFIPETDIDEVRGQEKVINLHHVSKARLDLKCGYCSLKVGACFQCSRNKCSRSYHATCAAAAGVFVERGETAVYGDDGTEYKIQDIAFSCKFHRAKRDKKTTVKDLEKNSSLREAASKLKKGDICQFLYLGSKEWFAGPLVENRMDEGMLLVDIIPSRDRVEIDYKWLMLAQPSDYTIIPPSANAIPIPKAYQFATSKRQSGDRPRPQDKFGDDSDLVWAEYVLGDEPKNPNQVKIDLSKDNQIWYYLGKKSTEAKAQFTEDIINKPVHNPKGLFLETLPKLTYPLIASTPRQSYPASHPNQNAINARSSRPTPQPQPQPQPQPSTWNRVEKPYTYKPRVPHDVSFTVDPQALQRRDEYMSTAMRAVQGPGPGPGPNSAPQNWRSPLNKVNFYPPSMREGQSSAGTTSSNSRTIMHSPFGARATSGSGANTHGRQSSSSARVARPNPFARYAYLQKEHNRSPLEYRSPYMPNGGFMNGYQGSLMKHLQSSPGALSKYTSDTSRQSSLSVNGTSYKYNALPQNRTPYSRYPENTSFTPTPATSYSPSPAAYSNPKPNAYVPRSSSYTSQTPPMMPPHSTMSPASTQQKYGGYGQQNTTLQQSTLPPLTGSQPSIGSPWERKDPVMHPAIRKEYMFHNNYQSSPSPPVSLPQAKPDNPIYQSYKPQQFQTARQPEAPMQQFQVSKQPEAHLQQFQVAKQPHIETQQANHYYSPSHTTVSQQGQSYSIAATAAPQYEMPAPKPVVSQPGQAYSPAPPQYEMPVPKPVVSQQGQTYSAAATAPPQYQISAPKPAVSQQGHSYSVAATAPPQYEMPTSKPLYPHQQYFQKSQQPNDYGFSLHQPTNHSVQPQQGPLPQLPPLQQLAPMLSQQYSDEPLAKIAECPPDVSNCVSHLMANLRKVAK